MRVRKTAFVGARLTPQQYNLLTTEASRFNGNVSRTLAALIERGDYGDLGLPTALSSGKTKSAASSGQEGSSAFQE